MSRVRPILYNTEMVQAILREPPYNKTVTRRVVHGEILLNPEKEHQVCFFPHKRKEGGRDIKSVQYFTLESFTEREAPCQKGDVLYVREAWAFWPCIECMAEETCNKTPTTHEDKEAITEGCYIYRADHPHPERIIWRPSIHMPKAAARIWLRVTDVHVQRLQEMTMDDFAKEGVTPEGGEKCNCAWEFDGCREDSCTNRDAYLRNRYTVPFAALWDSTIPKDQLDIYSWPANPWVWVIEFERCEKPESEA